MMASRPLGLALFVAFLVTFLVTGSACAQYDYLEISVVSDPPTTVEIDSTHAELYVGTSVVVKVDPVSSVRTDYADDREVVELRSLDGSILQVREVDGDDRWLLSGNSPGETCIEVRVKSRLEECIPATVRAPRF